MVDCLRSIEVDNVPFLSIILVCFVDFLELTPNLVDNVPFLNIIFYLINIFAIEEVEAEPVFLEYSTNSNCVSEGTVLEETVIVSQLFVEAFGCVTLHNSNTEPECQ